MYVGLTGTVNIRRGGGEPSVTDRIRCGCDSTSAYLERNPGWQNFAVDDETAAHGALAEFHRRRMARFVRLVKESTDSQTWNMLQQEHPNVLRDVIRGRSITWEELDTAEHPEFGRGQARKALRSLEDEFLAKQASKRATNSSLYRQSTHVCACM
jgi:hypothetical protein